MENHSEVRSWEIRVADELPGETAEKLSRFLESFKSSEDDTIWSREYYDWKIRQNIAHPGFVNLAVSGQQIVSSVSVTPKLVWYKGREITAAEIGDTYTDSQFQRRGIFAALINDIKVRAHDAGCKFIYGLPNEQSRPGYEKKCDFLSHPGVKLAVCSYLVNLSLLAGQKSWLQGPLRWLTPLQRGLLALVQWFWMIAARLAGIRINEVSQVDERYDRLWQELRTQSDTMLIRDRDYLDFRFFRHPLARYRFYEATCAGQLVGYLVSRVQTVGGRRTALIADWFYDRRRPLVFPGLLHRALRDIVEAGAEVVSAWVEGRAPERRWFRLAGFFYRHRQPIILHQNELGRELLQGRDRWHFTIADSDNG